MARDTLREWQDKNHPWLELTDIHRETTENIRVTVMPFYIGSRVSVTGCLSAYEFTQGVLKQRNPGFNFAVTSVNVHQF